MYVPDISLPACPLCGSGGIFCFASQPWRGINPGSVSTVGANVRTCASDGEQSSAQSREYIR